MIPQNLSELEHFRSDPRVKFKEETVGGVEVVIPVYMIADSQFWTLHHARELRGHTYRKDTGELIGVAFHKFFNVGEREETLPHNIDWDNLQWPQEKVDGSMINPVVIIGEKEVTHGGLCDTYSVHFKTKKSFYSDVAIEFTNWFWKQSLASSWAEDIKNLWLETKISPIFEFYHPDWQIVLDYGSEPSVWLLNTRSNLGSYYGVKYLKSFKGWFRDMSQSGELLHSCQDILALAKTIENKEGWVLYNPLINELYKVKTDWYLQQHKLRTQMRVRDVAEMAALEKLDDVKSLVTAAGLDLGKIEAIEKSVSDRISSIIFQVEDTAEVEKERGLTAKDMALAWRDTHPYFGLVMHKFNGKEPDYIGYFMKHILKQQYGLNAVYNEKF